MDDAAGPDPYASCGEEGRSWAIVAVAADPSQASVHDADPSLAVPMPAAQGADPSLVLHIAWCVCVCVCVCLLT